MKKATFANGVVWVYDENVNSPATHYGDENGVQHALVSEVSAADDAEPGFSGGPAVSPPTPSYLQG